jgi:putative ABC transport system permease protein
VSAIIIGVAFLSGTLVLTATVRQAIREQAGTAAPGLAVTVTPEAGSGDPASLPGSLAKEMSGLPGVAQTQGEVLGPVDLVGPGKATLDAAGVSVGATSALQRLVLKAGRYPSGPGEMAVDETTIQARKWAIGDTVEVAAFGPESRFRIVGVVGEDVSEGLQGKAIAAFSLPVAQALFGLEGRYSEIEVSATSGTTPEALASTISGALGPGYGVSTSSQIENNAVSADFKAFSLLSTVLVVLGAIVLFVAAFLVVNTFSIVVTQRTRELGLLRCLGASRAQLMGSVLAEALVVGVLASVAGVVLGIVGAVILLSVLPGAGLDLPAITPEIHLVAIFAPLALGAGATLVASVLPAARATSIPPVAALRDDPVGEVEHSTTPRAVIGTVTFVAGIGLLLAGLFANINHEGDVVGAGAVLTFIALASLSPLVARPLARILGWPLVEWCGLPAALARQNAMRNPRRTASTAAALLVGVALVSFMAVITSSARASATENVSDSLRAGFVIEDNLDGSIPLGNGLVDRLGSLSDLSKVVPVSFVRLQIFDSEHSGFAVNLSRYESVVDLGNVQGDIAELGPGTAAVSQPVATSDGFHVGEIIPARFGSNAPEMLRICAIYPTGDTFGGWLFSATDPPPGLTGLATTRVFVQPGPGVSVARARASIASVLRGYPQVQVNNQSSLVSSAISQVDLIVNLITVILVLAVIVGLVGIVNTLALSVLERTRELGLLRAIGMSRSQMRSMVRHESLIVALLGSVAGIVVGVFLAWAMQKSLVSQGLNNLQIPVVTLVVYLIAAGASGVLAGILPARRAADLDILAAIASE